MKPILYVYDSNNLNNLQNKLSKFRFYSIAYLFNRWISIPDFDDLFIDFFENTVIDLTNLLRDKYCNRISFEQYLYKLSENIPSLHFCINSTVFGQFAERFPYFFKDEDINWEFHASTKEEQQVNPFMSELNTNLRIYTYDEISVINNLYKNKSLVSLSSLLDQADGVTLKYELEKISRILELQEIEYIDLSSTVKMIKLRPDLIFLFENLIHNILGIKKVKYCIESSQTSDLDNIFPLCFSEKVALNSTKNAIGEKELTVNINNVTDYVAKICKKLKGHDSFKSDFQRSLQNFILLNEMGERKIMSIMLFGESGIGKTQFAKFASEVMYPGEPLIKINFGNYSSEGVLNSLIGSPLGYIGSEEGGELINKIETSKSKVILIDEFEKATPSVYNFFYELLDEGVFTDRHGVSHDLNGYLIIFTSNMTQNDYIEKTPDSLQSRFDMVCNFVGLSMQEKQQYINETAIDLIEKLRNHYNVEVNICKIKNELDELCEYNNLRTIKRNVEDIIFTSFFKSYQQK